MAKFLKAEKQNTQYYFQVHIDESKKQADGSPDPAFVKDFSFPVFPPEDKTNKEYLDQIKADLDGLVRYENTKLQMAQASIPETLPGFLN